MAVQTFNAQTRIPKILLPDIKEKLESSGMTISEYLRNLIMLDLGKFPINIPTVKLDPEYEELILKEMKKSGKRDGKILSTKEDVSNHIKSL
jgi:hypothetical protein